MLAEQAHSSRSTVCFRSCIRARLKSACSTQFSNCENTDRWWCKQKSNIFTSIFAWLMRFENCFLHCLVLSINFLSHLPVYSSILQMSRRPVLLPQKAIEFPNMQVSIVPISRDSRSSQLYHPPKRTQLKKPSHRLASSIWYPYNTFVSHRSCNFRTRLINMMR